ncbi:uncharacterized protein [Temnothorax nylanderi]|uniref:uncharacterized protein isoform X7 n=1 Tax=Temnothorax nylanderi TaxID=102681 RepID=UPI003A8AD820
MGLMEPKHDFEDMSIQVMYEYNTYAKARKASIKAEEDSAIDTAAGETDVDRLKPRKRNKPSRYENSDNSEIDEPDLKKSKSKHSFVNDSSSEDEEEGLVSENIRTKVKALLDNKKQLSPLQDAVMKKQTTSKFLNTLPYRKDSPSSEITSALMKDKAVIEKQTTSKFLNTLPYRTESQFSEITSALMKDKAHEDTSLNASLPLEKKSPSSETSSATTVSLNDTVKDTALSPKIMTLDQSHHKYHHVAAVLRTLADRQEELNEIQTFLMSDDNFYPVVDYFVKLMKIDSQTDEYTAVGRLLPKIISNSLARMMNFSGSGDKLKFENTKLHEAISCAVLNAFPQSNLTKMEKKISRWLYTSNQRKVN